MIALTADPPSAEFPAAGGTSIHQLTNSGSTRLAFKVKSSNNNEYRLKPVFGFVEPEATASMEILRLPGPPKEDRLVIQFLEVPSDAADPQSPFKDNSPQGEIVLAIKAE